ncbi:hypothetical protein BHE74_00024170, partial [Ensete ventricosum]
TLTLLPFLLLHRRHCVPLPTGHRHCPRAAMPIGVAPTNGHSYEQSPLQAATLAGDRSYRRLSLQALPLPAGGVPAGNRPLRAGRELLPAPATTWLPLVGGPASNRLPL